MESEVPVRLISPDERAIAHAFQGMIGMLLDFYGQKNKDLRTLKAQTKRYANYPFVAPLLKAVAKWNRDTLAHLKARRAMRQTAPALPALNGQMLAAIKRGDLATAMRLKPQVDAAFDTVGHAFRERADIIGANPYAKPWNAVFAALFGDRDSPIHRFEEEDMRDLVAKDLDQFCYTYLRLPENKVSDYRYLVYWIGKLQDSDAPVLIDPKTEDGQRYREYQNSSQQFDEMKRLYDRYVSDNSVQSLRSLVAMIETVPDLKATHDAFKKDVHIVYRGVGLDNDVDEMRGLTAKDVARMDREQGILATSRFQDVAERFAFMIGHMESPQNRRSDKGFILTYEVTPDAILLDTDLFGQKWFEAEIVIDVSKATLKSVRRI